MELYRTKTGDGTWQTHLVSDLASQMALPFKQRWHTDEGLATLFYGFAKVRLPGRAEVLTLCVADLPGHKDRLMLITNLTVRRACEAKGVIQRYFLRWDIEDTIRFGKQELAWEGFRVRGFEAIQNIELLAMLALSFLSCLHRLGGRFLKGLIQKAKGLFQTPVFPYYRIIALAHNAVWRASDWRRDSLLKKEEQAGRLCVVGLLAGPRG